MNRGPLLLLLLAAAAGAGALLLLRPGPPAPVLPPAPPAPVPAPAPLPPADPPEAAFEEPPTGFLFEGFRAEALYRNRHGRVVGVRWVHGPTGSPLVLLRAPSMPELLVSVGILWTGDRGEPHSGEHLLLTRGGRGRRLLGLCDGLGATFRAWTRSDEVQYGLGVSGGEGALLSLVDPFLEAVLRPDYTDEEIRREVYFVDVREDPATGRLEPVEAGTLYNEMSAPDHRREVGYEALMEGLAGPDHPLACAAGGTPEGLRASTPEGVRAFHDRFYRPGPGFRLVASLPPGTSPAPTLRALSRALSRLAHPAGPAPAAEEFPPLPGPPAERPVRIIPYPGALPHAGGWFHFGWPAVRGLSAEDEILAGALMELLAGGQDSLLRRRLAAEPDRFLRGMEDRCSGFLFSRGGVAVPMVQVGAIAVGRSDPGSVDRVRSLLLAEVRRIAGLRPGEPELEGILARLRSLVEEREAWRYSLLDAPPGFGSSSRGFQWIEQIRRADAAGGRERSLLQGPDFAMARHLLASGGNGLPGLVERLGLGEVPLAVAALPDPGLLAGEEEGRRERLEGFLRARVEESGGGDEQAALRAWREAHPAPGDRPPPPEPGLPTAADLVKERGARLRVPPIAPLGGEERILHVGYEGMDTLHLRLELRLEGIPDPLLPWLAALPRLLSRAGVLDPGGAVPHERLGERYGPAVHALAVAVEPPSSLDDPPDLRLEVSCEGPEGAAGAVRCLEERLFAPALDGAALDSIRERISGLYDEASWVALGLDERGTLDLALELQHRGDGVWLSALSSHTALLHLRRLELRLAARPSPGALRTLDRFLDGLPGTAAADPQETFGNLLALARAGPGEGMEEGADWVVWVARLLSSLVPHLDHSSREAAAADLRALADLARRDLRVSTEEALGDLGELLRLLRTTARARCVVTGPAADAEAVREPLAALFARLGRGAAGGEGAGGGGPFSTPAFPPGEGEGPLFLSTPCPPGGQGSFCFSVPGRGGPAGPASREEVARTLGVYAVGRTHRDSVFEAVREKGLAYGIGISGRIGGSPAVVFYGVRCHDLPRIMEISRETIRRLAGEGRDALAERGAAAVLGSTGDDMPYPDRAASLAARRWRGLEPSAFHEWERHVTSLLADPASGEEVGGALLEAVGPLVPGGGDCSKAPAGTVFVVAAPEGERARWEGWWREREGVPLRRFAPRDLWVVE